MAHDEGAVWLEQDSVPGKRDGAHCGGGEKKLASCSPKKRQTDLTRGAATRIRPHIKHNPT
jgi:hypothetical protein